MNTNKEVINKDIKKDNFHYLFISLISGVGISLLVSLIFSMFYIDDFFVNRFFIFMYDSFLKDCLIFLNNKIVSFGYIFMSNESKAKTALSLFLELSVFVTLSIQSIVFVLNNKFKYSIYSLLALFIFCGILLYSGLQIYFCCQDLFNIIYGAVFLIESFCIFILTLFIILFITF